MTDTRRPRNSRDIKGQRFSRLIALNLIDVVRGKPRWLCVCDCGKETVADFYRLTRGSKRSCGCLHTDMRRKFMTELAKQRPRIGTRREYESWRAAKDRCTNPEAQAYRHYGGRGIKMSSEWLDSYQCFYSDMGPCPDGYSLDRIDNNGPYTGPCAEYPQGNCRWADHLTQCRNKRDTIIVECDGIALSLKEWSERSRIGYRTLLKRHEAGLPLLAPVRHYTKKSHHFWKRKQKAG